MSKLAKILSLALALTMLAGVALGEGSQLAAEAQTEVDTEAYEVTSAEVYQAVLGDFYQIYMAAKDPAITVSERYAKMAIAEAKLMGSAVMIPLESRGGQYAITRIAPRSGNTTLWGNDADRVHQFIIVKDGILTGEQVTYLRDLWNEVHGTGEYDGKAKAYLQEQGYELTDVYNYSYASDPNTWDVLATSKQADSRAIINTYDGLFEYDEENIQQPALSTGYTVSEDGRVYTFTIREGVKWVDSQGREVADVKADDWVAGMQHMCDAAEGLEFLVTPAGCNIVGAEDYINGVTADFSTVGVKALDDYTLEYTLVDPCPFFTTMLGYGVFAPLSRDYYTSQGGQFGADYNAEAETYLYGKDPDHIAYNGPYLVTNATAENTIVFQANPSYWNTDHINIHTVNWYYNDGTDATSFMGFFNVNRTAFANFNDATKAVSPQTVEDAARTKAAMQNLHFRRALLMSLDRGAYEAQTVGEDLKLASLINSYTPGNFVYLEEETTVEINGESKTFPAGTYYGEIMQAQLDADGVAAKVWDPETGMSSGFDGWYNTEAAAAELALAVAELAEQGVVIDADHPIYIDVPTFTGSEIYNNREEALKQSVAAASNGAIVINKVACATSGEWYYAGYYFNLGYEGNFDLCDLSGWGPDYGDPQSYLDTMLPDYAGYMVKALGIY